jgi:hypothetical protein
LVIISVLVLQSFPEKLFSLSSLEGSNLVPVRQLLLLQGCSFIITGDWLTSFGEWSVLWGSDAPFLGGSLLPCYKDVSIQSHPSWSPRWPQERDRLRVKETDRKWKQGSQALCYFSLPHGPKWGGNGFFWFCSCCLFVYLAKMVSKYLL